MNRTDDNYDPNTSSSVDPSNIASTVRPATEPPNAEEGAWEEGVSDNLDLTWARFMTVIKAEGLKMSNLAIVFFFEFTITTALDY